MKQDNNNRRNFLKKAISVAGASVIPGSVSLISTSSPDPKKVEFITRFPTSLSLQEYRDHKINFENKDKVSTLISVFKKSGKMLQEDFSFHHTYCVWTVAFKSDEAYQEWMTLTEELESHKDTEREDAGFSLEIRTLA